MKNTKSPLRYPGGKQKALKLILPQIPECREFREPFVGGGSVFLAVADRPKPPIVWINDLNEELIAFWNELKRDRFNVAEQANCVRTEFKIGYNCYEYFKNLKTYNLTELKALRFFILNRITFSGTIESGGYSQQAFEKRFTQSSIDRLLPIDLTGIKITHGDFERLILESGEDVFLFLDPPYLKQEKSKLYGKSGDLHTGFDHDRLASTLKQCPHRWLMTYDDSPRIRELYSWAKITEWSLCYGMTNCGKSGKPKKGNELFIQNF